MNIIGIKPFLAAIRTEERDMVPAVRPLGSLSMARGCARIDSRLLVIFRPRTASELGQFIPQQRTSGDRNGMSVSCQSRKFRVQRRTNDRSPLSDRNASVKLVP
jgi:hypothetical protein